MYIDHNLTMDIFNGICMAFDNKKTKRKIPYQLYEQQIAIADK